MARGKPSITIPLKAKLAALTDLQNLETFLKFAFTNGWRQDEFPAAVIRTPDGYKPTTKTLEEIYAWMITPIPEAVYKVQDGIYHVDYLSQITSSYSATTGSRGTWTEIKPMTVRDYMKKCEYDDSVSDPDEIEKKILQKLRNVKADWNEKRSTTTIFALYAANVREKTLFPFADDFQFLTLHQLDTELLQVTKEYESDCGGIDTPWLYIGVRNSMFALHTENLDAWSISYLHYGAPKIWYIIPMGYAIQFERLLDKIVLPFVDEKHHNCPSLCRHKNLFLNPTILQEHGIPVYKVVQKAGEFVIIPPRTHHWGYNTNFNIAEAVNFGSKCWLPFCFKSVDCSEKTTIRKDLFLYHFDYEKFNTYLKGEFEMEDPETGKDITIPPPALNIQTEEELCSISFRGVNKVTAYITYNGAHCVHACLSGFKGWLTRDLIGKLCWEGTNVHVVIPDNFFDTERTDKPPVWRIQQQLESALAPPNQVTPSQDVLDSEMNKSIEDLSVVDDGVDEALFNLSQPEAAEILPQVDSLNENSAHVGSKELNKKKKRKTSKSKKGSSLSCQFCLNSQSRSDSLTRHLSRCVEKKYYDKLRLKELMGTNTTPPDQSVFFFLKRTFLDPLTMKQKVLPSTAEYHCPFCKIKIKKRCNLKRHFSTCTLKDRYDALLLD